MDSNTEYSNSYICQTCANCCKVWVTYVYDEASALRTRLLDTDIVEVIKLREGLYKVIFDIPCKNLIEKNGKYYCKEYDGNRPDFCRTYPNNFRGQEDVVIENESKTCLLMRDVIAKG